MTKAQRNALNTAKGKAAELREKIESLDPIDLEWKRHYSYGTELTNILYDLEKDLKAGGA